MSDTPSRVSIEYVSKEMNGKSLPDVEMAMPDYRGMSFGYMLRTYVRLLRVIVHILFGFVLILLSGVWVKNPNFVQAKAARFWFAGFCRILNVHVELIGDMPVGPRLIVSNHISWLDIPLIGSITPVYFLSKAEVGKWPLVGSLVKGAGTLFIQRGSGQVYQRIKDIAMHIKQGRNVVIFPEGTTTSGEKVKSFAAKLFDAAVKANAPVNVLAIKYCHAEGGAHPAVPFIDDDEFHHSLWGLLKEDRIDVQLHSCSLDSNNVSATELAARAHAWVSSKIATP